MDRFEGIKNLDALLNRRAFLNDHIYDKDIVENNREISNINSPKTPGKSEDALENADELDMNDEEKNDSSEIGLGFTNTFTTPNKSYQPNGTQQRQQ